jgi:hypothetical protein
MGGPIGRDLGLGQPAGVHVAEQVVLRADVGGQLVYGDPAGGGGGGHAAQTKRHTASQHETT